VRVPEDRLDRLARLLESKKTTYLEHRLLDFPAFSVGKKGPPPRVLGALATCDLLVDIVRAFESDSVPHPLGGVDPWRDTALIDEELALADLAIVERRIEKVTVEARSLPAGARAAQDRELALLRRLKESLEAGVAVRSQGIPLDELALIAGFNLLTAKPMLVFLNVNEADAARFEAIEAAAAVRLGPGAGVVAGAARAEADVAELPDEDAGIFRRELRLPERSLAERLLQRASSLLGLVGFFTVSPQEARAWAVPAGTTAQKAAGRVHSDMERGFIRAEVITWSDLLDCGSFAEAKRRGVLRTEGKGYIVQEGDVLHVLFNV
jgi:hypothetical protein